MAKGKLLLIYGAALAVIAVVTFMPLLSAMTAEIIANANKCLLDEGSPHPCVLGGSDWGHTLYNMYVEIWLMLFTLPAGVILFLVWLGVLIVHLWRRRKRD